MAKNKPTTSILTQIRSTLGRRWKRILFILLILGAAYWGYKMFSAEPKGVTTATVKSGTLTSTFSANGKIKAKREANLKFLTPGKISWVAVKAGDNVRAWQGLAGLSTVSLNAQYQIALNNLRNTQAVAESVLDSVQGHSKDETFALRATRTTAEVSRDNTFDAIKIARESLTNATIVAPFAGTIIDTNGLTPGAFLVGSDMEQKHIRLVDFNSLYFEASVDEVDYSKLKMGQEVKLDVDAFNGKECIGKVSAISRDGQETAGGVVTIPVEVAFSNCKMDFAVGLNGRAYFVASQTDNTLIIPRTYIVTKDGEDYVWKQTGKTTKQREQVKVKLGNSSQTEVEVLEGLSQGDTVIYLP